MQLQKLSLLPPPKQETLSRHSLLGPNGLRGQWSGPSTEIKVQYLTYSDFNTSDNLSLMPSVQRDGTSVKDFTAGVGSSTMESVFSSLFRTIQPSSNAYQHLHIVLCKSNWFE